ncbi:chloride conductance regulatory protein ICln-like isoform X1 [Arachis stenosperma]|uniref:chloride conductance regulatory protein ICln-like isoform X1 n=1 Tax=Arachis stenosperma TaxID=217475 RepID=UPI0025ABDC2C|nr:chloride conductance regulatory protein ICln-like isoform X1 [Arachis stenosperma]XP_057740756.1 chloride conductance regulatory protein ICln-like isoform X1 [Arachis stenosperma]XP_057740757.1 chloride conductance regulatory protein ICln-like isoform X1 [Arachis stenosperma]XP_057740758.1 chloride conductance regulatory protein ICln-like isoform X1 [Arachis stenosperma]XP_057740759.1 chloride conductance regulatory protein ICln-like isoform X1 [Arachis stenosperma]
MGLGLRNFTERNNNGQPVLDTENGEELMHMQRGVDLVLANLPPISSGTLYITTKQVIWLSDVDNTKGYAIDFLSISLHAVSRDPDAYPYPCLYTQIDTNAEEDGSESSDSESSDIQDLSRITEMRLIPSDPSQLDTLFQVFCECAELNPEPNDEEGEEHDWVFSADQMEGEEEEEEGYISANPPNSLGQSNGHHDLARTVLELHINDQRFEDAEEMEHGEDGTHN